MRNSYIEKCCPCCQKPLALIYKRASSLVFAVRKLKISLELWPSGYDIVLVIKKFRVRSLVRASVLR